jgi:GNAT superfamily N-acetyltransferase
MRLGLGRGWFRLLAMEGFERPDAELTVAPVQGRADKLSEQPLQLLDAGDELGHPSNDGEGEVVGVYHHSVSLDGVGAAGTKKLEASSAATPFVAKHTISFPSQPTSITLGYDIASTSQGWLEGHQIYLCPEFRGQGFAQLYFKAALALAESMGLKGFRFAAPPGRWKKTAEKMGFAASEELILIPGTKPVVYYSLEAL